MHSCSHWPRGENPQPDLPPPPHLVSYTRALLVSQDRRNLFVIPCPEPTVLKSLIARNKTNLSGFLGVSIIVCILSLWAKAGLNHTMYQISAVYGHRLWQVWQRLLLFFITIGTELPCLHGMDHPLYNLPIVTKDYPYKHKLRRLKVLGNCRVCPSDGEFLSSHLTVFPSSRHQSPCF